MPEIAGKSRIFYGYWVLVACLLLNIVGSGCGPIGFSFFVTSLERSLGWSRTEIMTAFMVFFICSAISAPLAGRMVHRYGARTVVTLGGTSATIGYIIISQMNALWHYYVGYAFIGFGVASIGPVVGTLIVSNWFILNRGLAVGTMSMGPGTAGLILTPTVIIYLLPTIGWSNTYLVFAAITAVVTIPLGALVIRTEPAVMGLYPDGGTTPGLSGASENISPATQGLPFKTALSTAAFWLLSFAILFVSSHMGVMQSQLPHLEDLGFTPGIVASAMIIVSVLSALGPVIFGWLSDRFKVKTTSIISIFLITISVILLLQVNIESPTWLIWTYAILLGLGVGGWMTSMALLTSYNFGLLAYGVIYGVITAFQSIGAAVAPIIFGYYYDSTGSYHQAFIITIIIVALGMPLILVTRRPRQRSGIMPDRGD